MRYASSLKEIENEVNHIKNNYECIYTGSDVKIEVYPNPARVDYDGSVKEFKIQATITDNS